MVSLTPLIAALTLPPAHLNSIEALCHGPDFQEQDDSYNSSSKV
jgi:hypothetical protein